MRDVPGGVTVAIHTCRGNFKSTWMASGGYDPVAETVFTRMNVNAFFLEYDTDRAGGFEPLRFVPKGKTVVLGLISSKVPTLESKDALKRRIESAAKYVPLENLCLSPQCGFSSTHHGNKITVDDQKRKLALALDVARGVGHELTPWVQRADARRVVTRQSDPLAPAESSRAPQQEHAAVSPHRHAMRCHACMRAWWGSPLRVSPASPGRSSCVRNSPSPGGNPRSARVCRTL